MVRSTWDSVDRPAECLSSARRVAGATALANPLAAIEWDLDTAHLRFHPPAARRLAEAIRDAVGR